MKGAVKWLLALFLLSIAAATAFAAKNAGPANPAIPAKDACALFADGHEMTKEKCTAPKADEIHTALHANPFYTSALKTYDLDTAKAVVVEKPDQGYDFKLIVVPVKKQADKTYEALYVWLDQKDGAVQRTAIFHTHTAANGDMEISYRDPDGKVLTGAIFNKGEYVRTLAEDPTANGEIGVSVNWRCWWRCINAHWGEMPALVKLACEATCGACLAGVLYGCPVCAACVGYWGGYCKDQCPG